MQQQPIWFKNHPSAASKEGRLQQGAVASAGQSACLVNRRILGSNPSGASQPAAFALWVLSWTLGPDSASAFRTAFQLRRDPRTLSFLPTDLTGKGLTQAKISL